jgi:hypothetical protein
MMALVLILDFVLRRSYLCLIVLCWCALTAGCGGDRDKQREQSNLRALAVYYGQYQAMNRGQLPADEKDFKDFIVKGGINTDLDSMFISIRDGKPFVVRYRRSKTWPLPDIVIYEQDGRDGTRDVATVVGGYEKMSDEEFDKQMAAAASKR